MARLTHGTSPRSIDCQWSRHILCLTPSTCNCPCHKVDAYRAELAAEDAAAEAGYEEMLAHPETVVDGSDIF